mmetsp:Transcript_9593/g.13218  ORF Transcript_9593/g.13218 Transcript_9593/m.13218 type:complete len:118 (-) Transcript_9593:294-647(-)
MGPSGAGKTTLLNGLSGRAKYAKVSGSIVFAGRTMNSADLTFVPQFDELNSILTVEDHIHLVGHLTCVDKVEMQKRAADLMEVLGLVDAVKEPVGGRDQASQRGDRDDIQPQRPLPR